MKVNFPYIQRQMSNGYTPEILEEEIRKCLQQMCKDKDAGRGRVSTEILKSGVQGILKRLTCLCNKALKERRNRGLDFGRNCSTA